MTRSPHDLFWTAKNATYTLQSDARVYLRPKDVVLINTVTIIIIKHHCQLKQEQCILFINFKMEKERDMSEFTDSQIATEIHQSKACH